MTSRTLFFSCFVVANALLAAPAPGQCPGFDDRFGPATPDNFILTMATWNDGNGPALYAGGTFEHAGGVSTHHIARFDGTHWSALVPTGQSYISNGETESVQSMVVFDEGQGPMLFVGGDFAVGSPSGGSYGIARWDGANWSSVGLGLGGTVNALAVYDDGNGPALYAGGSFTSPASRIARWDGHIWSPLGTGVDGDVFALAVFDDGTGSNLYAGGYFYHAGGVLSDHLACWNGSTWLYAGAVGGTEVDSLAVFDDGSGPALFAGGRFTSITGVPAKYVARFDLASRWTEPGGGVTSPGPNGVTDVLSLQVFDDGSGPALYAGGSFGSMGSTPCSNIARWDGDRDTRSSVGRVHMGRAHFLPSGLVVGARVSMLFIPITSCLPSLNPASLETSQ